MTVTVGKFTIGAVMAWSIFGSKISGSAAQMASLVQGNTAFALDLYSRLKNTPGNLFFSPYSISTALAMTYAGARAETEKQMAKVFHFDTDQKMVHASFGHYKQDIYVKKKGRRTSESGSR